MSFGMLRSFISRLTGIPEDSTGAAGAVDVINQAVEPGHADTLDRVKVLSGALSSKQTSGTAGNQLVSGPGVVAGFQLASGSATCTLALYDGTSAAGVPIYTAKAAGETLGAVVALPAQIEFKTGLYAVAAGTTPVFNVYCHGATDV